MIEVSAEKFWERVLIAKPTDCWLWQGKCHNRNGYGIVRIGGKEERTHRVAYLLTHGADALAEHELIRHACHNPPCVNPHHLIGGSRSDNAMDDFRDGRRRIGADHKWGKYSESDIAFIRETHLSAKQAAEIVGCSVSYAYSIRNGWARTYDGPPNKPRAAAYARGSSASNAKLSERDVEEIRARISLGESNVAIAASYGVTGGLISKIRRGRIWRHLPHHQARAVSIMERP